jgi:hypothetical protein
MWLQVWISISSDYISGTLLSRTTRHSLRASTRLCLKADAIHINDKEDVLFSAGFLYELGRRNSADKPPLTGLAGILDSIAKNIVLEGWVSMPSTGDPEVYTLKLNYVIKF